MSGDGERNVYRVVVFAIMIVAGLGLLWLLTQDGVTLETPGIFDLFSDPAGEADPAE